MRIEGDLPVLLSNGNPVASGTDWPNGTIHGPNRPICSRWWRAIWSPIRHFHHHVGRDVDLNIWVRPGDEDKCAFGMEALKASMTWDEEVYGREYDSGHFQHRRRR